MTIRPGRLPLLVALTVLVVPLTGPPPAAAAPDDVVRAKVDARVREQVAGGARTAFWLTLPGRADLSGVRSRTTKPAKGAYVRAILRSHAENSQAGLRRFLRQRGADFTPFWITNAIRVTGGRDLVTALAQRPDVARITPEPPPTAPGPGPAPQPGRARADDGVEWNIERVRADRVWRDFGVRGEGVVVATIDSGVMFDHPALLAGYRGRYGNGRLNHNYNWYDAGGRCPTEAPCDDDYGLPHGTHVMGIQVGGSPDGANRIGVAPGARWIAARARGMADQLSAGQWMLAPTDLSGANPRPELAPDVVNNSWHLPGAEPGYYADVVAAWVAAGIFPVFAAGNAGREGTCQHVGWPPSLADAYTVGNTDAQDRLNPSSSRGPTVDGLVKPDVSAPGTGIRSAVPTGEYDLMTGTSQAAPHVAGAVALLWSAAPALDGDVAATRRILDGSATPVPDLACGGTAEHNNAAGHGLVDLYAAVRAAPRTGLGGLRGVLRDAVTGQPLPDATVLLTGPRRKVLSTGADGSFRLDRAVPGSYPYRITSFGHADRTGSVTVRAGAVGRLDVTAAPLPSATVTGTVRAPGGAAVAGATVGVDDTPVRTVTGADGRYRLTLPKGGHDLVVDSADRCLRPGGRSVTVAHGATADVDLPARTDAFGHTCTSTGAYRAGEEALAIAGRTGDATEVPLPFPVTVYGRRFDTAWIATDGVLAFGAAPTFDWSSQLPDLSWVEPLPRFTPDLALYPFHARMDVDAAAGVYTAATADTFVVEWRNVLALKLAGAPGNRISVSATLHRDGSYTYAYRGVAPGVWAAGRNAVVGLADPQFDAFVYGNREPVVTDGLAVTIRPPAGG
ncbi:S8 family serine peptidase [Jidongwangia harbinensis]|uniref:S8 family serine peptidase n=1 Tax=Jidongwangia harbinensis TaxID=2878561 RepID=UPI001CD9ABD2|nr:S8 family serine peptidase [Jidongwangia harbinensis]MCA2215228.1 S8 family serine peptidase [Jidongwangia harbinensis]